MFKIPKHSQRISYIGNSPLQLQHDFRFGGRQNGSPQIKTESSVLGKLRRKWRQKNFANFFMAWLTFTNFLLILPFRVVKKEGFIEGVSQGDRYVIKKHLVQQVLSALFHISTLLNYFGEFRIHIVDKNSNNPVEYLSMFDKLVTLIHNFVLMYIMWRKSPKFLKVVNKLAARKPILSDGNDRVVPSKRIGFLVMLIYALFSLSTPLILNDSFASFDDQFSKFEARIQYYFFLRSEKPPALFTLDNDNIHKSFNNGSSSLEYGNETITSRSSGCLALTALFFVCFSFRSFMGFFTDALVLVTALSLWHPVADFAIALKRSIGGVGEVRMTFKDAYKEYRELKELSGVINDAVQTVVFTFVIQAIFFYSIRLKEWITNCGPGSLYLSFFFVSFFLMFYFAADICKQVDNFRIFIYQMEEKKMINMDTDVVVLLHELSFSPIGISGKGRFVINPSFIATLCGTLLTYFIVTVQSGNQ